MSSVTSPFKASIRAVRRATSADAVAIAKLASPVILSTGWARRDTFVIDGEAGPIAMIDLVGVADCLRIEHVGLQPGAPTHELARALVGFAERSARIAGFREVRLRPGSLTGDLEKALGYHDGVKRLRINFFTRVHDHLDEAGIPMWRDGYASFDQTLYYRGIATALALLIGLGGISVAVFSSGEVTLAHIVLPALLCSAMSVFAFWQMALIAMAARRARAGVLPLAALGVALIAIAILIQGRAVPSITELWNIYSGDEDLSGLAVHVSADGTTLRIEGPYGTDSADTVGAALQRYPSVRNVVLAGPGGRIGAAFKINRMIRQRRLNTRVDTTCASACTIAFLGGVERTISPGARLGFHQGSFPGLGSNDMYESNRSMKRFLIGAGVTSDFAQRVIDTPPDEIWVPSSEELLAGRVIHRVNR